MRTMLIAYSWGENNHIPFTIDCILQEKNLHCRTMESELDTSCYNITNKENMSDLVTLKTLNIQLFSPQLASMVSQISLYCLDLKWKFYSRVSLS